ncbi:MAG: AmmeMemoRadiSam system protein B [Candidatus Promineifilaceae bacterium]|nr:AmmeMemoRadiSam system protein B [Candidatus Promineifilaceae bacterium]
MSANPRLRPLDFQPVLYEGQQMWLLRDPLELTDYQLILPPAVAQVAILCDGTRSPEQIPAEFVRQTGMRIDAEIVHNTLAQLDEACLLVNERSRQAIDKQTTAFRALAHRPPALAGLSYPAEPAALTARLLDYGDKQQADNPAPWNGRGVISPHIDYHRGGPVYAQVWRQAAAAARAAELVLIFGTDHNGSAGRITLTRQAYATPFGVLPTDETLVDRLADAVGPTAFAEELHHRNEHSIELSAVWLHHVCGRPVPTIPILCGSFHHFVANGHHPDDEARFARFVETLQTETAGKRVLAVASVDLAHVGPSFGDEFVMDEDRRQALKRRDGSLMEAISQGAATRFFDEIAAVNDRDRICGFSAIYLLLRYLGQTSGRQVAYTHCPADQEDNSLVSICGLLLE